MKATVLLVTLWLLAILSLLAIGIGFRITIDLKLVRYQIDKLKAYEIAKAGVIKAISELEKDEDPNTDTPWECGITLKEDETFDKKFKGVNLGEGHFDISYIEDVQGKININTAPKSILASLFSGTTNPGELSDNIMAWRGYAGESTLLPAPPDYSDKPYTNKNAPFDCIGELLLVKDIIKESYDGNEVEGTGIKDLITVYPKDPSQGFKVNINTAGQRVLEVLFEAAGLDKTIAGKIVDDRKGPDGDIAMQDDNIFCRSDNVQHIQQFIIKYYEAGSSYQGSTQEAEALTKVCNWLTVKSNYFKICSVGALEGRKSNIYKTITCVVEREMANVLPHKTEIVSWVEE